LLVLLVPTSVYAQSATILGTAEQSSEESVPVLDSPEAVSQLVSRLTDGEVRELLLQQLDAVAEKNAEPDAGDGGFGIFSLVTSSVPLAIQRAIKELPKLVSGQVLSFGMFADTLVEGGVLGILKGIVLILLAGIVVEFIVRRLIRPFRSALNANSENYTLGQTLKVLCIRLILDLSGLLAFVIVTQMAVSLFIEDAAQFVVHHMLWNLIFFPRFFSVFTRFFFAPQRPDLRLMHTSDESAQFLHRHLVGVAVLIGVTLSIIDIHAVSGAPPDSGSATIGFWFNLIIHFYFGFIAWRSRTAFIDILDGPDNEATPMEKRVARWYPYYALIVIVGSWLLVEVLVIQRHIDLIQQGVQYSTMMLLLLAPFLDTAIRGLVRHLIKPVSGNGELAQKAHRATKRCYIRVGRVLTVMLVLFLIASIWSLDFSDMSSSSVGTGAIKKLLDFIGINAVGYLVWEVLTLLLNRKLASEQTALGDAGLPGGDEGGVGGSRLSTVLPLITWFIQVFVIVMTLLISLGSIGVDTTPLLAGAGIVRLAIGFGAQTLVGDIVSGLFFLIDDAFRAGEYVNIEGTVGTVERISLRAMQLRHHRGAIHTIPYGQIPKITNYSRDWTIMKLTFTVPFETDLIKVKRIFKRIGQELMEIPEFADDFLQPFKSQGVIQVDDVGIVIRGKFMVKPGKQFMIRKEIFQRVQSEFEKNGIQFARKEVRVKLDSESATNLNEAETNAIGAAALEASNPNPEPG